jgi:hypothetical protein
MKVMFLYTKVSPLISWHTALQTLANRIFWLIKSIRLRWSIGLACIDNITFRPEDGGSTFLRNMIFFWTARPHVLEDNAVQSYRAENLKSNNFTSVLQ